VGAAACADGQARVVLRFTIDGDRITGIEAVAGADALRELDIVPLDR